MSPTTREARIRRGARGAYIAVILLSTLAQLHFDPDPAMVAYRLRRALAPGMRPSDVVDGLRNLALYAGLGAVWVLTSPVGHVRRALTVAALVGAVLSVSVETMQLFSPVRTSSILDVMTNTGGAWGGAVVVALILAAVRASRQRRSGLLGPFGVPMVLVGGAYMGAVLCEAATPLFRQDPLPEWGGGGISDRVRLALSLAQPPSVSTMPILDIILFFPAGLFCTFAFMELEMATASAWAMVAIGGTLLALLAEVAHGAAHQTVRYDAVLAHAIGLTAGAIAARLAYGDLARWSSERARAGILLGAYAALLGLWAWRPFVLELHPSAIVAQLTPEHLVPLASLSGRADLFSVAHIVSLFLLWLPLGSMLAVWPVRARGVLGYLLPALYLAVLLEAGHIVIADRWFDVTNALVQIAGVGAGWIIMRRAGYRPNDPVTGSAERARVVTPTAR